MKIMMKTEDMNAFILIPVMFDSAVLKSWNIVQVGLRSYDFQIMF